MFRLEMRHETVLWLDLQKLLSPSCRANPYRQIPDSWWIPKGWGGSGRWDLSIEDVSGHAEIVEFPFDPSQNGRAGEKPWSKEDHLGRIRFFVDHLRRGKGLDPVELDTLMTRRALLREGWHRVAALAFVGRKKVRVKVEAHPDDRKVDALRYRRTPQVLSVDKPAEGKLTAQSSKPIALVG